MKTIKMYKLSELTKLSIKDLKKLSVVPWKYTRVIDKIVAMKQLEKDSGDYYELA